MANGINDKTEKFIRQVKKLVESGRVASYQEIADAIEWDRTALSNVVNKRRNVPPEIYLKFSQVYLPAEIKDEGTLFEIILQNQAVGRVLLRAMAEILSRQRDESVTKTLSDLEGALKAEIHQVTEKLR